MLFAFGVFDACVAVVCVLRLMWLVMLLLLSVFVAVDVFGDFVVGAAVVVCCFCLRLVCLNRLVLLLFGCCF